MYVSFFSFLALLQILTTREREYIYIFSGGLCMHLCSSQYKDIPEIKKRKERKRMEGVKGSICCDFFAALKPNYVIPYFHYKV